jgi:hemerythrin-like domain-containing protein
MTESLTMNQVIHGAVRRDLDRLATALELLRDGDRDRARGLERAFRNLHVQLTNHHEGEDRHVFPMLQTFGVDAPLIEAMESEHQAMSAALSDTAATMGSLARSGSAADAAAARESVVHTRSVVNSHLGHEEDELEPQLRPHLESPEWKAVEKKLSRQPPGVAGRFFAWLTDGMSDEHRAYLKATVPTPVVTVLARVFGRQYYRDVAPVWQQS